MDIFKIKPIRFSDVFPGATSDALDAHFKEQGWELQVWDTASGPGYQVYFGEGVQVDNLYEYGFPHLFEKEDLRAFAENFYAVQLACRSTNATLSPESAICKMEVLDSYPADGNTTIYVVSLEPGFLVDVKANHDTSLVYVMQNEDGSSVYDQFVPDITYHFKEYDEAAVVEFVKAHLEKTKLSGKPELSQQIQFASSRSAATQTTDSSVQAKQTKHDR